MARPEFSNLIEALTEKAREASAAETQYHKDMARQMAELKQARAFAWRRVNLLRAIAAAVKNAEDEEKAAASARKVFYREVGWNGGTQNQRDVAERFEPVTLAIWAATREEEPAGADEVEAEFDAFETWYGETRESPFLALMERDIIKMPLVEV